MQTPFVLLKFVAKAVLSGLGAGLAGDFAVDVLPAAVKDVWSWWAKDRNDHQRRADIQAIAQAAAVQVREEVTKIVREVAADRPRAEQQMLTGYLIQVPAAIRQSLRRPSDPTGTTLPRDLLLEKPQDLLPMLPARPPRFKPGDQPLPGVDWELVEMLGTGGFGEVWKARNPHVAGLPPVALKFCLDPQASRILGHEAQLLGEVMRKGTHPGIVKLLHTYLNTDPPCLEYEYVAGGDLAEELRRHRKGFPPPHAAQIVLKLANIIGYAHQLTPPIVHRDLKPANILVQPTSPGKFTLKVADFGIGSLAASRGLLGKTSPGLTQGQFLVSALRGACTPLYASPQQARGEPPDPRDDVYSLGVIWYQLLAGDLTAGRPGGTRWHRDLAAGGMSRGLLDLLAACLEDRPEDRAPDAATLAAQLRPLVQGAQTETTRNPVPEHPSPTPPSAPVYAACQAPADHSATGDIVLLGTTARNGRTPRELKLEIRDGSVRVVIHPPGRKGWAVWVSGKELKQAFAVLPSSRHTVVKGTTPHGRKARQLDLSLEGEHVCFWTHPPDEGGGKEVWITVHQFNGLGQQISDRL